MILRRVMFIAGEASGDLHGAGVVRALRARHADMEVFGVGGDRMAAEGMKLVYHIRELGFMGFVEVLKHLPFIKTMEHTLEQLVKLQRPDVLVLIDYPGFNLRFARIAKRYGVKIAYYISPQVWAWHRSRVKKMRGLVDKMLVIFPFEVELYRQEGIDAEFVGHPLLDVLDAQRDQDGFRKRHGIPSDGPLLALLPGSRKQEIEHIYPAMLGAARMITQQTGARVCVGVAPTLSEQFLRTMYPAEGVTYISGATYDVMVNADFAIVTSGTATLETACFGTPLVVVYRTSWLTYAIGRMLVQVKNISLVNIVRGKGIVPELIQHDASPARIAKAVLRVMNDPSALEEMRLELSTVRGMLGQPGAAERVADHIIRLV
ncbi:MAG: lipid-A-disaccharide synthase [Bacteroidetes bacterium]|nr:lipid-A-disaccharide synthase [Bacteroidota bacterium]